MGHKIRTDLSQPKSSYIPTWTHTQNLKELHEKYKSVQEKYYNNRHHVKISLSLPDKTPDNMKQNIFKSPKGKGNDNRNY